MISAACESKSCDPFVALLGARAPVEGRSDALHPGVHFFRSSQPAVFRKTVTFGPTLTVVAQGRKVARFGAVELSYAPCHYLVVTGETVFEGSIVEASAAEPYLCVSIDIPPDLIAKTLLAMADAKAEPMRETAPAFVAPIEPAIKNGVVRLLHAIDDPLERQIVAALILEELVFRLLRSDAASVLRRALNL
jgi:hypothetical protein